jgi:zeaxanthin glucosyltransferase
MTRVLFCVIPEKGHLNPMIGPAEHLRAAGAEVAFHAPGDLEGLPPERRRGEAFAAQVQDPAWLRQWIRALLVDAVADQVPALRRAIARFRPDVAAIDPMVYAAAIACELEGVPWAAISNSLNPVLPDALDSELLRTVRWLSPARTALFARYGLDARFRGCDLLSPRLTVAFTTEALTGGPVGGVAQVGPSLPRGLRGDEAPFPWTWLDGTPLVYMSLGSQIYHQPAAFHAAIAAVTGRPVQLVLSVAELLDAPELLGPLPPNVLAVRYAPQLALLARAQAFISHGGANSVMEAIAFGVPLLLSPLCNDQFHQVHFVEAAGIGRTLDLRAAAPAGVWAALDALLSDGPLRQRLAPIHASYQVDGAAETARLISALA